MCAKCSTSLWLRAGSLVICAVFIWTNVLFAQRPTSGFWEERRNVVAQFTGGKAFSSFRVERRSTTPGNSTATTPDGFGKLTTGKSVNYNLLAQLPALQTSIAERGKNWNSSFSPLPVGLFPATILSSISPYAEIKGIYLPNAITLKRNNSTTPLVVLIQDVHQHYEAQKNIATIIQQITTGIRQSIVIGVEGGIGLFNFSPYKAYSDKQLTKDIADFFMRQGMIGGPEFYGITASENLQVRMRGIEDEKLYLANIQAFKESLPLEKQVKVEVEIKKQKIKVKKEKLFNSELLELDRKREACHEGTLSLGEYLTCLVSLRPSPPSLRAKRSNLTTPNEGSEIATSPLATRNDTKWVARRDTNDISNLVEAYKIEKSLDIPKLESERSQILDILTEKLPQPTLNGLLELALSYKTGSISYARFYSYFKEVAKSAGIIFSQFHEMNKYVRYVQLSDSIDKNKLFTEIEQLETSIENTLAKTKEEKELLKESKYLGLAKKLVEFSLTPEEWKQYKSLSPRGVESLGIDGNNLNKNSRLNRLNEPKERNGLSLLSFEQFYETALKRNEVLVSNLLASTSTLTHVLIAGGFHSQGITQILKQKNIPYVVLTPNITKAEEGQKSLELLSRAKTPLEKLFAGEKVFLSAPRSAGVTNPIPGYNQAIVEDAFHLLAIGLAKNSQLALGESSRYGSRSNIIRKVKDHNYGALNTRELEVQRRHSGKIFRFLLVWMENSRVNLTKSLHSYQAHVAAKSKELLEFTIGDKTGTLRLVAESLFISSIVSALVHFAGVTEFHLALPVTTPLIFISLILPLLRHKLRFEWLSRIPQLGVWVPVLTPSLAGGASSPIQDIFRIPLPNFQLSFMSTSKDDSSLTPYGKDELTANSGEQPTQWDKERIESFKKIMSITMHAVNNILIVVSIIIIELLPDNSENDPSVKKAYRPVMVVTTSQIRKNFERLNTIFNINNFNFLDFKFSVEQLNDIFAQAASHLDQFITASNKFADNIKNLHQETGDLVADFLQIAQHRIQGFIKTKGQFDTVGTPTRIDVNASIKKILTYYHKTRYFRELKNKFNILFTLQEQLPPVAIDGVLLFEVWSNLIVNAVEAAKQKNLVHIETRQEGSMIRIDVTDAGPGIPPENLTKIFEPWFSTQKNIGLYRGIGLYLVKQIIENAGGTIEVQSVVGEGTTFTIRFPIMAKPGDELPPTEVQTTEKPRGELLEGHEVQPVSDEPVKFTPTFIKTEEKTPITLTDISNYIREILNEIQPHLKYLRHLLLMLDESQSHGTVNDNYYTQSIVRIMVEQVKVIDNAYTSLLVFLDNPWVPNIIRGQLKHIIGNAFGPYPLFFLTEEPIEKITVRMIKYLSLKNTTTQELVELLDHIENILIKFTDPLAAEKIKHELIQIIESWPPLEPVYISTLGEKFTGFSDAYIKELLKSHGFVPMAGEDYIYIKPESLGAAAKYNDDFEPPQDDTGDKNPDTVKASIIKRFVSETETLSQKWDLIHPKFGTKVLWPTMGGAIRLAIKNDNINLSNLQIIDIPGATSQPLMSLMEQFVWWDVLTNLFNNALQAMAESPERNLIFETGTSENYDFIRISDTGHGIAAEDINHIWSRHFSKKPAGMIGTGLGLPMTRRSVEEHGGTIEVQSVVGQGTTFTIRFPIQGNIESASPPLALTTEDSAKTQESEIQPVRHHLSIYRTVLKWLGLGVAAWLTLTTGQTIIGLIADAWVNQIGNGKLTYETLLHWPWLAILTQLVIVAGVTYHGISENIREDGGATYNKTFETFLNEKALRKKIRDDLEKKFPDSRTDLLTIFERTESDEPQHLPQEQTGIVNAMRLFYMNYLVEKEYYVKQTKPTFPISKAQLPRAIHYMAAEELASLSETIENWYELKQRTPDDSNYNLSLIPLFEKFSRIHGVLSATPEFIENEPVVNSDEALSAFHGLFKHVLPGTELNREQTEMLKQARYYDAKQVKFITHAKLLKTLQFIKNDMSKFAIRLFDTSVFTKDTLIQMWTNIRQANDIMNKKQVVIGLLTDNNKIEPGKFYEEFKQDFKHQIHAHFGVKENEIEEMLDNVKFGQITITGSDLKKEKPVGNSKVEMDPDLIYNLALKKSEGIFGALPENYPLTVQIFTPNPFRFDLSWKSAALQILSIVSAIQIITIDRQTEETLRQIRQKLSQA